jgi:probable addiction module antidote protein
MTKPYRSHDEALAESLARDPAFAAEYLNAVIEDGDQAEIMLALRQVADALGGVQQVAKTAELNPTTIYKTLSSAGNPELRSLRKLLEAMGLRIAIEPIEQRAIAA